MRLGLHNDNGFFISKGMTMKGKLFPGESFKDNEISPETFNYNFNKWKRLLSFFVCHVFISRLNPDI